MTREEVIEELTNALDYIEWSGDKSCVLSKETIELAMSALSAEEDNTTHWVDGDAICPKNKKNKFEGLDADIWADWKPMYCPNCGRKAVSE